MFLKFSFVELLSILNHAPNPTLSPTPPTHCHIDDGVDHANNFVFVEQEDDEYFDHGNQP
jgi:hypothetical protein